MSLIAIRDMSEEDKYFVGTCSHVNESEEIDQCATERVYWLEKMFDKGIRAKVALMDGSPKGFIHIMPIESSPWGPKGSNICFIPCLYVSNDSRNKGIGRKLLLEAEKEAKEQRLNGMITIGYYHDFWFMPAAYFHHVGFEAFLKRRYEVLIGKKFNKNFKPAQFLRSNYIFQPIEEKVVVDLFWNSFCLTSIIEAHRVREVCNELGKDVKLNEYMSDIPYVLDKYQMPRAIFINGEEYGWEYEAPKRDIKIMIENELAKI